MNRVVLILCLWSVSIVASDLLFFSNTMGQLSGPDPGALLIYGGNHGSQVGDENHQRFVKNSMSLFSLRQGYRLYIPESQDRGLTLARAPVTYETYTFMGHDNFDDVWGLENTMVRWEWKRVVRDLLLETGANEHLENELERFNDLMRSYFMAQAVRNIRRARPNDNAVAAIGGAHIADGVMIKFLFDRGAAVNYVMERSFAYGDFRRIQSDIEGARWKKKAGRREIQDLGVERLVKRAEEIERDPTKAYTPDDIHEVALESNRERFFVSRRQDAKEFLRGHDGCLQFLNDLGQR